LQSQYDGNVALAVDGGMLAVAAASRVHITDLRTAAIALIVDLPSDDEREEPTAAALVWGGRRLVAAYSEVTLALDLRMPGVVGRKKLGSCVNDVCMSLSRAAFGLDSHDVAVMSFLK
jgi:hypothetical protein